MVLRPTFLVIVSTGFLHLSVFGLAASKEESQLLGHMDVLKSHSDWSSLTLCPSRFNNEIQDRKLSLSGSPNLDFTMQIESLSGVISLNRPQEFLITKSDAHFVTQFLPLQDISTTQLDITVTSDSDVPAYLKVSKVCKDVKENIQLVDYKGESIRLSFAKKGRITLSKVSQPPLTDSTSSWFIGIALKNATGETKSDARKTGTLTLTRSFDYSYTSPISSLIISTFLSGIIISGFAFGCFKNLFYAQQAHWCWSNCGLCWEGFCDHLRLCGTVVYCHWFTRGPKTYSYITGIVGFVLMVGASQFVFANWHVMIHEGDRDNCYYNDFCYRVSPWHDIPYNLMMSNLVYMLHGVILAACVCCMEANILKQCRNLAGNDDNGDVLKGKISISIGYSFAWALIFEGCFSLIYHLFPSKMTFQFDTAFMFVITSLTIILLHNGIKTNVLSTNNARGPVGGANFFLYFFVPLLIFNYFGALHHFELHHSEKGMSNPFKIPFFVFLGIWWAIITFWAGYKLLPKISEERDTLGDKCMWFLFICFGVGILLPVVVFIVEARNLPQAFLYSCILESLLVILAKSFYTCYKFGVNCCGDCFSFFRCLYFIATGLLWGFALYYFIGKPTTDKVESPEISRDKNEECEYMNFFDYHDMWHILSSNALLMGAYLVMFMAYEAPSAEGEDVPLRAPINSRQIQPRRYPQFQT